MIWSRLTPPWQACVEEAWSAYTAGSLPIGAAICDDGGRILARGRNRIHERQAEGGALCGHRLAHAEINALLLLPWDQIDPAACALYTTTEPCPLCVGAVRMTRLRRVFFAARDGAAGSADLSTANAFMRRGDIAIHGPLDAGLEAILVALLVDFGLTQNDANTPSWIARLGQAVPAGLDLGARLHTSGELRRFAERGEPAAAVIDRLHERLSVD